MNSMTLIAVSQDRRVSKASGPLIVRAVIIADGSRAPSDKAWQLSATLDLGKELSKI